MNKRIKITSLLSLAAGFLLMGVVAQAQVPQLINYQGVLRDSGGTPITNPNVNITFSIYDAASGGNLLWQSTQSVSVNNGLFNVLLGSSPDPLPTGLFYGTYAPASSSDRYLGVKVGTDPEMTPRQQLVSVGDALKADDADSLGDGLAFTDANKTKLAVASSNPPVALLDIGGWSGIPGDISLNGGTNSKGDLFIGKDGASVARMRISSNAGRGFLSYNEYWNGSALKSMNTAYPTWEINLNGANDTIDFLRKSPTTGNFQMSNFTNIMSIAADGTVTAHSFSTSSSRTLKKDITPLAEADYQNILKQIDGMQLVHFLYKTESNRRPHLGVIAEDSPKQVLDSTGKAVSLYDYASFLLAGLKAQSEQIDAQSKQIDALTKKIEALEAKQLTQQALGVKSDMKQAPDNRSTGNFVEVRSVNTGGGTM